MQARSLISLVIGVAVGGCHRNTYRSCPPGIESSVKTFRFDPDTTRVGTLKGTIISVPDSQPLRNAVVLIDTSEIKTTTDESGGFIVSELWPGAHLLEVRLVGFRSARVPLSVPADRGMKLMGGLGWVCAFPPQF